jgi:S-adenosyl methyltransferase
VGRGPSENEGTPSEGEETPPPQLDTRTAHLARVWNYLLDGKDNFAADREVGDMIMQIFPDIAHIARLQRRFLARAVRYLAEEAGIRQFLDVGTGLPTANNTHQIAQQVAPESKIVYVDNDPLVLVHARALLTSAPGGMTSYIEADVRDTEEILEVAARTLDFGQPVALMMLGILGQVPDSAGPSRIVDTLMGALPPGSYLALSDGTDTSPALNQAIVAYNQNSADSYHLRSPAQIASFFDGLTLVPPGVVTTSRWRPGIVDTSGEPRQVDAICGVGRKDRRRPGQARPGYRALGERVR